MKLIINGPVKPYYIQMLAMLFYPGEKFPESEDVSDTRSAIVNVTENDDGVYASVTVNDADTTASAECELKYADVSRDKAPKFASGAAFVEACKEITGHLPPWGILTGVRPAKLAIDLINGGRDIAETYKYFDEIYKASPLKSRLAIDTAETSMRIVTPEKRRECSVYIAIPFCPTRCAYCSFVSYTSKKLLSIIPDYLNVLLKDIKHTFTIIRDLKLRVSTIYIGGGTPTVLNAEQLELLLSCIEENVDLSKVDEFTLEAGRPDTITKEKMTVAASHGVTRVSVNTQTLNEEVLRNIGRAHTTEDFFKAYELTANAGFRDINVDLIAGLPGDTLDSFIYSVDHVSALSPTNITVHTFSVKKSAEFKTGGYDVFDRDGGPAAASVEYSGNKLVDCGYKPYYMYRQKNTVGNLENVGYSKPGHEGLYNIFMMDEVHSIFACGASSVTKLVGPSADGGEIIERYFEPKYPYEYLKLRENCNENAPREELYKKACEFYDKHRF